MEIIKPSLPKGTRDFLPEQMLRRQLVMNTIRSIFEKYGYEPLETPSIETLEVLSGKYGEEGEQLIFKVLKRGTGIEKVGRSITQFTISRLSDIVEEALRYDLTVPLCRVVAMYQNEITLPFKRYQMQPVWRGDKPQKGRYREFYQCDADTVGSSSMLADAETIALIHEILTTLGFNKFKIRINNRKILSGIVEYAGVEAVRGNEVCIAIDKLEKIGIDGVRQELQERDISLSAINKILPILEITGPAKNVLSDITTFLKDSAIGLEGINELNELIGYIADLGIPSENYAIDLYLARGLTYYTGPIYESVVEQPSIGSLTGGGRYDQLVGMFLGTDIPATGTTIGIERIIDVMTELNMFPESRTRTQVLVTIFDENTKKASLAIARQLRAAGINTEIFFEAGGLKKQFKYANRKGIPFVVVLGPEEIQNNLISLKNMNSGEQTNVTLEQMINLLKQF
ncbi:MAG: histidine--tRNA ligase [candidate division KSB1 bacterium]|nr:histidine--tRNA ligase [candidate division KSB1 bacterium]MDZ7333701.1 histidine--tRNA ligase [candidate division KSB1 bacterium]MDZ7356149.1 histidine--tRNA ligase [candidate division KSB1 bacterium]MDZ7377612.1 histidine--tRNA ligase [candidate division KSB1 bacterium]MDZ7398873.1 histidine--tRNA ligase [candidate division KSB1 bacterium]